ncbi:secretin N-terminal domain-containing protein [Bradyrhizobium ivorense]|uniref:secretin N-terminal domain-containing protein n=1 Tax=Bradyrhizobium ivorense TaxID=2511166 RepID=UPI0010B93234|nr:secretin N-terminal domain-containing protein [Bradyrhizobium ivorense]VIO79240.1 Putative type II secretion system protein D [Bradyrhizobium ivorense]
MLTQPSAPPAETSERRLPVTTNSTRVSLDYVNADIRRVVNDVVGNILAMPVVIDPGVEGKITLRTSGKVPASDVPRLLDEVLGKSGYGLAAVDRGVRVARLADLADGGRGDVKVIPVRYVDPVEVIKVIRPNVEENVHLAPAPGQRGIAISGPPGGVSSARELIGLLDIDSMLHKSFALYTLAQASPAAVEKDLNFLFNQNAGGPARVRFASLERLNGILVVADDPAALQHARETIEKLDRTSKAAANVQVRPLKYRRATEVAQVLAQIFGAEPNVAAPAQSDGESGKVPVASLPGRSDLLPNPSSPANEGSDSNTQTVQAKHEAVVVPASLGLSAPVRIQADRSQNALVILAAPHDAKIIDAAIRRLDVKPRQVLIQAIVAEVRLNDGLGYGVDYLLSSRGLGAVPKGGLSYVFPGTSANVVLHALSEVADVKVVSAPRILAVDNQPATIQVGEQVPILSRSSQSPASENSPIISNVELRDTGVILAVTPRIGAGGSVTLDTFQEVSTANKNKLTNIQSPVISLRRLQSTVSTRNGDTIAIGGLMQDSTSRADSGLPLLMNIPLLGAAFRRTEQTKERTELLVLLNPLVLQGDAEAGALTDELRAKFESLAPELGRQLTPGPRREAVSPKREQAAKVRRELAIPAVTGSISVPRTFPESQSSPLPDGNMRGALD